MNAQFGAILEYDNFDLSISYSVRRSMSPVALRYGAPAVEFLTKQLNW
jgi:hypothetical protein